MGMATITKMKKIRNPKLPKCAEHFMKRPPSAKRHTDSTMDMLTTTDMKTNCIKRRLSVTSLGPSKREHTMKLVKSRSVESPHWAEVLPPPVDKSLLLHSLFLELLDLPLTLLPYTLSSPPEERQTLPAPEETWHNLFLHIRISSFFSVIRFLKLRLKSLSREIIVVKMLH